MEGNCVICLELLNTGVVYALDPCGHKFHTGCIMKWVRTKDGSCPICRYVPDKLEENSVTGRISFLRNYALRKDSPKELKRITKKFRETETKHKENVKSLKDYLDDPTNREILRNIKKMKDMIWKSKIDMIRGRDRLLGYPILLIPETIRLGVSELPVAEGSLSL